MEVQREPTGLLLIINPPAAATEAVHLSEAAAATEVAAAAVAIVAADRPTPVVPEVQAQAQEVRDHPVLHPVAEGK